MPSQRPYFLSSFLAAFRQQAPSLQAQAQAATTSQQPNKHNSQGVNNVGPSAHNPVSSSHSSNSTAQHRSALSASAVAAAAAAAATASTSSASYHTARPSIPIPTSSQTRRGSDSSSEGFRDAIGADKWYIGGRTATGEERFFQLGVIRRVRSNDGLSLDRLSL